MKRCLRALTLASIMLAWSALAAAQTSQSPSEEVEPRVIGTRGTMLTGFSGYVDRFFSSERELPFNYTAQVDIGRFISQSFVVRGGFRGSGSIGGEDSEDLASGQGAPALHVFGGLLYYFTPQSIVSLYTGADYWAQLTQRDDTDRGTLFGVIGVQGVLSSRVSVFLEGGYGAALRINDDEVRATRIVGQVGVRLKF